MRFISEDTNKGDVNDPLSLNLYTYCVGNPIKLVDIDGHAPFIQKAQDTLFGICLYVTTWFSSRQIYYTNRIIGKLSDFLKIGGTKAEQQIASTVEIGKTISLSEYESIMDEATHNVNTKNVMLGKYDGGGATSYISKAGEDFRYFDLGDDWEIIRAKYGFSNQDMFDLFNESFLDDGINVGKNFYFSHTPIGDKGFLGQELNYLLRNEYELIKEGNQYIAVPK